jgi:hypothetical protein
MMIIIQGTAKRTENINTGFIHGDNYILRKDYKGKTILFRSFGGYTNYKPIYKEIFKK